MMKTHTVFIGNDMDVMPLFTSLLTRILCFLSVCLVVGCAATGTQPNKETGPRFSQDQILRVGVYANLPPLVFKLNHEIVGLEAELAKSLAVLLGKRLHFVLLKWDELIPALLERRIDIIMSGMDVTEARKARITFSDPYLNVGQMALVRDEDVHRYRNIFDLRFCNKKVGTEKGTRGDSLVQKAFPKAQRKAFKSTEKAVKALINGKTDMLVHDAPVVLRLASEKKSEGIAPVPIYLTKEHLAWGLRYEDTELLKKTNTFLAFWRENGELECVIKKWMPYMH